MRILIADDHPLVRQGLKQLLAEELPGPIFGEAHDSQEAIDKARQEPWDVLVLDINMPGSSGLEVLQQLRHDQPNLPVLVLSAYPEDQYGLRALTCGASGYVSKQTANDELVAAVRKVTSGGTYVSPRLVERLAGNLRGRVSAEPHETLSTREFQVLLMLASGKSLGDIATDLFISPKTVSTYRTRVLDKLGLKSNVELAHYSAQWGLFEGPSTDL